jgi:protein disulfide-isomerase A1
MDAPENDLPPSVPFRVSGFPTLKFKPAGGREWIDYEGDRSLESLVAFVQDNAKNSLEPKSKNESIPEFVDQTHHDEL